MLLKRQSAIGELFRIEDVRRFVDKRAGSQHSGRHRLSSFGGLADAGRLLDGNQDMGAALRLFVIFLLGLILIEAVIPQPHASREVGSRVCRLLGRPRQIEGHHRICLTAKLANHEATKFRVIFWLRRHIRFAFAFPLLIAAIGAGANHDEPFGGKPGRRNEIERGQCLPLKLHGSGSLFDQTLSLISNEMKRRRAKGEILAHENDQGPRASVFPAGLLGGVPGRRLWRQPRERDKFDFHCFRHLFLCKRREQICPGVLSG